MLAFAPGWRIGKFLLCVAEAVIAMLLAMFGVGVQELLVVMVIALLLFGHRLPSMMRNLGRGVTEFKKGVQGVENDVDPPGVDKK